MFHRAKKIDDVIKEWEERKVKKVSVLPFETYSTKGGPIGFVYGLSNSMAIVLCSSLDPNYDMEGALKTNTQKIKGKMKSRGRIYIADKDSCYREQKKPEEELSNLKETSKILTEMGIEVVELPKWEFVGRRLDVPKVVFN